MKFRISQVTPTKLLLFGLVILAYVIFLNKVALPLFSPFPSVSGTYYWYRVILSFIMITVGWFGAWIMMLFIDGQWGVVDPIRAKPVIIIFSIVILLFTGMMFLAIYTAGK